MTPPMYEGSQVQDWQLHIWAGFMNDQFCLLQGRSHHLLIPPVSFESLPKTAQDHSAVLKVVLKDS